MHEHVPQVSSEHADRVRQWHERAYTEARDDANIVQTFEYLGRTIVVPPDVQPVTRMSHVLGEAVLAEVRDDDRVLDMGTGSGVNAILAASRSSRVLAVDINPHAVAAARENASRNGVADRVEVRQSDVFSAVDGNFDLIIFDPPFRWFKPRSWLEAATTDENYRALTTFFAQLRAHLAPEGRVLLFFGTTGDAPYLRAQIEQARLASEVISEAELSRDGWRAEYFTLRLSSGSQVDQLAG